MRHFLTALVLATLAVSACSRPKAATPVPAPQSLVLYTAQRLTVTPAGFVRPDTTAWYRQGPVTARAVDSALVAAFRAAGIAQTWIFPDALSEAFRRNRTYATDPYQLALHQLRSPAFVSAERYGEPLSSQLRTLIALHDDARFVLVPVELWFQRDGTGVRALLKLALLDPRFAHANWVGTVQGDPAPTPARALASVATRVTHLFAAP